MLHTKILRIFNFFIDINTSLMRTPLPLTWYNISLITMIFHFHIPHRFQKPQSNTRDSIYNNAQQLWQKEPRIQDRSSKEPRWINCGLWRRCIKRLMYFDSLNPYQKYSNDENN